ncbi:MAG: hypothetical protein ACYSX0_22490, partial [Planctomycetota bacterium]
MNAAFLYWNKLSPMGEMEAHTVAHEICHYKLDLFDRGGKEDLVAGKHPLLFFRLLMYATVKGAG